MTAKNYIGILGVMLVIVGGMCPMLRVPILGNWNFWDIDTLLASIVYSLSAVALIAAVTRKQRLLRICGWLLLLMLVFTITAVYFKANDYFSFIPIRKLANIASKLIKFKWLGWGLMFAGSFIIILFSGRNKVYDSTIVASRNKQ